MTASSSSQQIHLTWLNGPDIAALAMTDQEILDAVEQGLRAQGQGQTVIEPRMHLVPDPAFRGHFNVLRGYVAPMNLAGVKIVGDYVDNYSAACRRRWRCSISSIPARVCRWRSLTPLTSRRCAPAP